MFKAAYKQGNLQFFLYLYIIGSIDNALTSLATFCRPNPYFTIDSFQHHVHICHRRENDEQKGDIVV